MNVLLLSNIKKSLKIITEDNPEVPDYLIDKEELGSEKSPAFSIARALAKVAAQPIPSFYHDVTNELQSPQEAFFGFYVLRNAVRGIFLGLRNMQAGDLLRKYDFFSASVTSYYTAAFHLLSSFLAWNGRVIIENLLPVKVIEDKNGEKRVQSILDHSSHPIIIAILTKNNTWKFEGRSRTHGTVWNELEHILLKRADKITAFFTSFFKYILHYENSLSEINLVRKGIQRLIEVRHESIYRGYGYDDITHDAITNREHGISWDIGRKSKKYRDFAIGLLRFSTNEVLELKEKIPAQHFNSNRILLTSSLIIPPFELGDLSLPDKHQLTKDITRIYDWVMKMNNEKQRG
jgi:hypothetical protein